MVIRAPIYIIIQNALTSISGVKVNCALEKKKIL